MNDFSRILYDSTDGSLYNAALVSKSVEAALRTARDEAREAIRSFFGKGAAEAYEAARFQKDVAVLIDEADVRTASELVKPKFRTQGSFSYHTHVEPETSPPQEIDIDDGMFLPVSYVAMNGSTNPQIASDLVFRITEAALSPLCEANGWELVTNKDSCVRIKLPDNAHLDIALYAVPDREFELLIEKVAKEGVLDERPPSFSLDESAYESISEDEIRLATRESGWIASDPRLLEDWFKEAVATFGDHVRVVSRILKVWRDCSKGCERLASVALMYAVVDSCENGAELTESRYDSLIAEVVDKLPNTLSNRIPNPRVEGAYLDQNWSADEREVFVTAARDFSMLLNRCLSLNLSAKEIIVDLRSALGRRVPLDSNRVLVKQAEEIKGLSAPVYASEGFKERAISETERVAKAGTGTRPYYQV
ncbi:CBASS cGAMP synthase [Oricola sp.]|uniref:CBASS cGAMP synthase n=1 Tax=Oricola sp. TaxID=1979950 RepID=UPI0025E78334|nr:CBASS cGAMP synthase [Oricola sp.]MCI5074329.1 hypothetical protein [Oricola sp.]